MTKQFLIKNGIVYAEIIGATTLKNVNASRMAVSDALNAKFPRVLVGANKFRVSSAAKYQKAIVDDYAKPLPGGRPEDFFIY